MFFRQLWFGIDSKWPKCERSHCIILTDPWYTHTEQYLYLVLFVGNEILSLIGFYKNLREFKIIFYSLWVSISLLYFWQRNWKSDSLIKTSKRTRVQKHVQSLWLSVDIIQQSSASTEQYILNISQLYYHILPRFLLEFRISLNCYCFQNST